jgi:lipopolysaccharide/colanic/teichoic acid biosynthesis glycosyltransferase
MTSGVAKVPSIAARSGLAGALEFPKLALPRFRRIKRFFDISAALFLAPFALILAAVTAVLILLESGRPVFFVHERIGRGSRRFRLWKFRTMVVNGAEVLERHFEENPDRLIEWQHNRKLRNDPRVTRVGRILRRSSLDELPQLWNVLRGDMSLVGPRPIVQAEVPLYGSAYRLYSLTSPGLTGLWQVSGRNDTSYRRRIELDSAYVRRWSPTLDLRLMFKTVRVVLSGKGAY